MGDNRSRDPGCVTKMLLELDLPALQDRKQQRLLFFYEMGQGLVPAMPIDRFPRLLQTDKRQIKPTKFRDFLVTNVIENQAILNSRPFQVLHSNIDQYNYSFLCSDHRPLEPPE